MSNREILILSNIFFFSRHDVSVIDIINSRGKSNFRIRVRSGAIIWWSDHEAIVDSIYFLTARTITHFILLAN